MKRMITAAFATLVLAGTISAEASAQQWRQPQYAQSRDYGRNDRRDDRYDNRYDNHQWRRGDRLDRRYAEVDYRRYHLRAPQRGYHYVRDDRGNILLAVIATGIIASIIASN